MSMRGVELLLATWIFPEQGQQFKSHSPGAPCHELILPRQQRQWCPGHGHWRSLCAPWESSQPQGCPFPLTPHSFWCSQPSNSSLCSHHLFCQVFLVFFCKALQTKLREELGKQVSLFHASLWVGAASFLRSEGIIFHFRAFVPQACATMHLPAHIGESPTARGSSVLPCAPTPSSCFSSSLLRQTDHSCDREWGLQQPEVDYCT